MALAESFPIGAVGTTLATLKGAPGTPDDPVMPASADPREWHRIIGVGCGSLGERRTQGVRLRVIAASLTLNAMSLPAIEASTGTEYDTTPLSVHMHEPCIPFSVAFALIVPR